MSVKVGHLFYWSASEDVVNITIAQDMIHRAGKNILVSRVFGFHIFRIMQISTRALL